MRKNRETDGVQLPFFSMEMLQKDPTPSGVWVLFCKYPDMDRSWMIIALKSRFASKFVAFAMQSESACHWFRGHPGRVSRRSCACWPILMAWELGKKLFLMDMDMEQYCRFNRRALLESLTPERREVPDLWSQTPQPFCGAGITSLRQSPRRGSKGEAQKGPGGARPGKRKIMSKSIYTNYCKRPPI